MTKNVIPWSYSSLTKFETCPRQYKLTRLTGEIVEPPTEATTHGKDVHKALEDYLTGDAELPPKYENYRPIVERVKATPGELLVEHQFALTSSFKPTEFMADDAWVRGVIDASVVNGETATSLDWKTGKPKEDGDQMRLFAAATFALYPEVNIVNTGYVWLAYGKISKQKYKREDVAGIWQDFLPRITRLVKAKERDNFVPKPSGLCRRHCPVTNDLCEFSGRIR
jgi:hypothetical protein